MRTFALALLGSDRGHREASALLILLASLPACAHHRPHDAATSERASAPAPGWTDGSALTGRIVFDNSEDIFVINADGTGLAQLTHNPGPEFDPMWSPNGSRIVYRDSRRGVNHNDEIYVMNPDGSAQINLSRNPANDWGPAWSPDGKRIAFNSDRSGGPPQLFVMNADGSGITRLTDREGEYPTWSPDGTMIAFMSSEPEYHIYRINADGTLPMRLSSGPGDDGWPVWSPDGTRIAFTSQRTDCRYASRPNCKTTGDIGPYQDIWTMNPDGTEQRRTTEIFGQFSGWSPNGRYLIFNSFGGLFLTNPFTGDTHTARRLPIQGVAGDLLFADWKP